MRIISDFHDYYDIGMKSGVDSQLPYMRFRREEAINPSFGGNIKSWFARYYHFCYFGFAGKIWSRMDAEDNEIEPSFSVGLDSFEDSFFIELAKKRFNSRLSPAKYWVKQIKEEIRECFEYKNRPEFFNLFEQFKTAIFVYKLGSETIVINERLNQYNFQKALPPMQAFQELAMYVGSYLTKPVIEEPPLSDKVKAEIHGFDKFSFRKAKQK